MMYRQAMAFATLCILTLVSFNAHATTALEMASSCKPIDEATLLDGGAVYFERTSGAERCWGAFIAVQQAITTQYTDSELPAHNVCAPAESTLIQLVKIFRNYVVRHPEKGHARFFNIAMEALRSAYPCR